MSLATLSAEINYSVKNLLSRPLRSWLTILSILIGVMAVFALISFGYGIRDYVNTLSAQAGADKLFVMQKGGSGSGLDSNIYFTKDEFDFIQKINGVQDIVGFYLKAASIEFDKQTKYNFLIGYDPKKRAFAEEAMTVKMLKGRGLRTGDADKVVLGYNYLLANKIFKRPLQLGDKVIVSGQTFTVVGFYAEVGDPQDDGEIFMTDSAMEQLYPGSKDKFAEFLMRAQKGVNPDDLAKTITVKLRKHLGEKENEESFYVQSFADAIKTFSSVLDIINGVLVLIAFISVIVASVNIMNTMYTSVIERTREIGIMKAIGARNSEILTIFVIESGILGMVGGIIGVFLGYLIASLGGIIAAAAGYALLKPVFPIPLIVACIMLSFLLGAVSGFFPALQASKLKPVEALRYE